MNAALGVTVTETAVTFDLSGFTPSEQYNFHAEYFDAEGNTISEISGGSNKVKADGTAHFSIARWDGGALARVHARAWHDDATADVYI